MDIWTALIDAEQLWNIWAPASASTFISLRSYNKQEKFGLDGDPTFCRKCYIISWTKDSCMKVTLESLYTLLSWHQRTFIFIMQQTQNLSQMKEMTILSKEFHKTNTYLMFRNGNKNM